MGSGLDGPGDVLKVPVHLGGGGPVADMADRQIAFGASGREQVSVAVVVSVIAHHLGLGTGSCPDVVGHPLLACAGFVLKPDFVVPKSVPDGTEAATMARKSSRDPC